MVACEAHIFPNNATTLKLPSPEIGGVLGNTGDTDAIAQSTAVRTGRAPADSGDLSFGPEVRVLVATDAAGEGVNLQNANLMVNYDLPWNRIRLEQRSAHSPHWAQEVCHLWNLSLTRLAKVMSIFDLLEKFGSRATAPLKRAVFDILGEVLRGSGSRTYSSKLSATATNPKSALGLASALKTLLTMTSFENPRA